MGYQVNGYFQAPQPASFGGAVPAPGYPAPVVVPVNNAGQNNTDAYIQSAIQAAPIGAGVMPGKAAANGIREYKTFSAQAARMSRVTKTGAQSSRYMSKIADARSSLVGTLTGAIKSSLIFNGIMSVAVNGWKLYKHEETTADAGANFAGDMTSAVVGGAAAGVATGVGTFVLSGILGAGLPLTLAGMAIGAGAYFVADNLLRQTTIYNKIKSTVHGWLGA